ncbi:MAG: hypothetical protein JWL63_3209 [Rhodocyclales bacterium]|nr:hypothetical protein [Rhodocyclales bacterium]
MSKHTVLSPLKHDGEDYAEGDQVELKAKEAQALVEAQVVSKATKAEPAEAKK